AAGKDRAQRLGQGRGQHQQGDAGDANGLMAPVPEGEAEHVAERIGPEVEFLATHFAYPAPLSGRRFLKREYERHSAGLWRQWSHGGHVGLWEKRKNRGRLALIGGPRGART